MTQYNTGTVTVAAGQVTGSGTSFDASMVGKLFSVGGTGVYSLIASYINPTRINLADTGINAGAGSSYAIWLSQTPNLGLPLFSKQDADPTDGLNRTNQIVDQALSPATSSTLGTVKVTSSSTDITAGRTALTEHLYASNSVNYHNGNLNVNEFGGKAGSWAIRGVAQNTTGILFFLPTLGTTAPTSITIEGTFAIRTLAGTVINASTSSLVLQGVSSPNLVIVSYLGSGFTPGENYLAVCNSNSSTITVNF